VELTEAASRAIDDGLLAACGSVMAASPGDPPRLELAADTPDSTVAVPDSRSTAASRRDGLVVSDTSAEMVVKLAKDYQHRAFENIKVGLGAALDYTKELAEMPARSEATSNGRGGASPNNFLMALGGASAEFRAEALMLMRANMVTTLEYARELAGTKTPAEFVELSGRQARKQCELMLKQAGALKSLAVAIAKSDAE
jgi:hypothetical protein